MELLSRKPKPTMDYAALAVEVERLREENRIRSKYGNNLSPEQMEFYIRQEKEAEASRKESAAAEINAAEATKAREAEMEGTIKRFLDEGVIRVYADNKRAMATPAGVPCPSCGNVHSRTRGVLVEMVRPFPADVSPSDLFAGMKFYQDQISCSKCKILTTFAFMVVPG